MLGIGIVLVVMAPYIKDSETLFAFKDLSGWSLDKITNYKNTYFLALVSMFGIAQFFGAPNLGEWSDQFGRKKVVIWSMVGGALGYLVFTWGVINASLLLLFVGRLITGFASGGVSVLYSIISDLSTPETKTRNFGILGAAFGLGFIIGPALGALLADDSLVSWFNESTPFYTAAFLSLLSGVLIYFTIPETNKPVEGQSKKFKVDLFQGIRNIGIALKTKSVRNILTVLFLVYLGFTFFTQYSSVYLIDTFDVSEKQLGNFFTFVGIVLVITQAVILRFLTNIVSSRQILAVVLLTLSIGLIVFLIPKNFNTIFYVAALMPFSFGLMQPNILNIISNMATKDVQGRILGIQQSIRSLSFTVPPIASIFLSAMSSKYPNLIGAIIVFLAWVFFVLHYKQFKVEEKKEN